MNQNTNTPPRMIENKVQNVSGKFFATRNGRAAGFVGKRNHAVTCQFNGSTFAAIFPGGSPGEGPDVWESRHGAQIHVNHVTPAGWIQVFDNADDVS